MKLRLTGTLVLVLGLAALASASAYAGNGHGNGHGNNGKDDQATSTSVAGTDDHGNSANAPGQLKKDEAPAQASTATEQTAADTVQAGVKPSSDTTHDTHAAASSDKTKLYGNGKTAGQIAIHNGAAPSTVLHGPGNSQPHKASPCSGGHEVDVHALKGKRGKSCGGPQPPSPEPPSPHPTPDPGKPGDPAHDPKPTKTDPTPSVAQSPVADPKTTAQPKPAASPKQGGVAPASGVLSGTEVVGRGTLPFTGFPIWIVVLIAIALIVVGVVLRRRSTAPLS
jgi:hypothetical protein